jgi:hypothetical protein
MDNMSIMTAMIEHRRVRISAEQSKIKKRFSIPTENVIFIS